MSEEKLLVVDKLRTEFFQSKKSSVTAINEISFYINKGEIVGLVGESGCGKSVTSLSIMRLLNFTSGKVTKGEVLFEGTDLQKLSEKEMRQVRGGKMSMIFQEPMSSLNPAMRIDKQLIEQIRLHTDYSKEKALERAAEMLKLVGIPDPPRVLKNYPHQLSGGMSQRVMIAMAMSCNPQLLIADEPTTALDVTIQAQILELMKKIQKEEGMSILLITHDLGVVAEMCTRVIVMYAGEIVEEAPVDGIPLVDGMDPDELKLYHKLKKKSSIIYQEILEATREMKKYELSVTKIMCRSDRIYVYIGNVCVSLGNDVTSVKVAQIPKILEKLEGKEGTLHLENFSDESDTATFDIGVFPEDAG